jgi:hypothetical protein
METTVRQAIELLSKMDPDAILCTAHIDDDVFYYNSIETIRAINNVEFINDSGDDVVGNIVSIL